MNKYCIATHGYLAKGYQSALSILTGISDNVSFINAYVEEKDWRPRLDTFIASIGEHDTGIIFTDILGGSVFQQVILSLTGNRNILHITGINLGLVIELLFCGDELTAERVQQSIDLARSSMQLVNEISTNSGGTSPDEDFFA